MLLFVSVIYYLLWPHCYLLCILLLLLLLPFVQAPMPWLISPAPSLFGPPPLVIDPIVSGEPPIYIDQVVGGGWKVVMVVEGGGGGGYIHSPCTHTHCSHCYLSLKEAVIWAFWSWQIIVFPIVPHLTLLIVIQPRPLPSAALPVVGICCCCGWVGLCWPGTDGRFTLFICSIYFVFLLSYVHYIACCSDGTIVTIMNVYLRDHCCPFCGIVIYILIYLPGIVVIYSRS